MRILYLNHMIPEPEMTGDLRHFHFLKGLSMEHDVRLLVGAREITWRADDVDSLAGMLDRVDVVTIAHPRRSIGHRLMGYAFPRLAPWWPRTSYRESIDRAIQEFRPDVIHASIPAALHCHGLRDAPIVVDICDAISLRTPSSGSHPRAWWAKWNQRRVEAWVGYLAERVTLISERDARAVCCPRHKVRVVPNGVDLDYYSPGEEPYDDRTVTFVGAMDYRPNADAALHFANDVWPLVRASIRDAWAYLVGRNPGADIRSLDGRNGITVTGTVDDIRPYVRRSVLTVAPLLRASGMQNKVVQSLAMGVPAVISPAANGGLGASAKDGVVIASRPTESAEAVVALMSDRLRRELFGANGRRYVEENFRWDRAIERLLDVYREAVHGREKSGVRSVE